LNFKLKQSLKQSQQLTMTPQLQQAIKLLTLTHLEMTNVISAEMVENPMLEEIGGERESADADAGDKELKDIETKASDFEGPELVSKDDFDWEKYLANSNENSGAKSMVGPASSEDAPNYENMVSQDQSLLDHLEWQARMHEWPEGELLIAIHIINNIDDDGFLTQSVEELIKDNDLEISLELGLDVLNTIQRFDPVGCASKDTKEALIIQARELFGESPVVEKIIDIHLEDLYKKHYQKIADATNSSLEAVKQAELSIMTFHPRPGRLISSEITHYIVPDIYVVENNGKFEVKLNDEGVPRLRISKLYKDLIKNKNDANTKEYVEEKLRNALWLLKSISNRQKTIVKVSEAIIKYQPDFFVKGSEYLRPMILKDIAAEVEMHESTISRVTTNKYMHTPLGTFELKYFFSSGLGGKDGGLDIAAESLKLKIKALISKEDPARPLSDQKIANLLANVGIKVARRTVAKYRESLGILSSSQRKIR